MTASGAGGGLDAGCPGAAAVQVKTRGLAITTSMASVSGHLTALANGAGLLGDSVEAPGDQRDLDE